VQKTESGKLGDLCDARDDDDHTRPFFRSLIMHWRISKPQYTTMTAKLRRPIAPAASSDWTLSNEAKRFITAEGSQAGWKTGSIIDESMLSM
jgi:hypothetical protein